MGKKIDLTGQQFGYLTVLEDAGRDNGGGVIWLCKCKCGNKKKIKARDLKRKNGGTRSCGCLLKEKNSIDLVGQTFGKLTVLEDDGTRSNREIKWKCKCECGNICHVVGSSLRDRGQQSCGCEKSRGESTIIKILTENNIPFETQKIFKNCINLETNAKLKFDFWIDNKYLIEYDGIQHFQYEDRETSWNNKENFLKVKERDIIKNKYCFDNNIPIIRIPYWHYNDLCLEDLVLETSQFLLKQEE